MYKRIVSILISLCMCTAVFAQESDHIIETDVLEIIGEISEEKIIENQIGDIEEIIVNDEFVEDEEELEQEEIELQFAQDNFADVDISEFETVSLKVSAVSEVPFGAISDIDLSSTISYMTKGSTVYAKVYLVDEEYNVTNLNRISEYLTYESKSPDIIEVSNDGVNKGKMTGKNYGSSTILVTYDDGTVKITKKMIVTCYKEERHNGISNEGEVSDPLGYTEQTVYKGGGANFGSSPEVFTFWFFDDMIQGQQISRFEFDGNPSVRFSGGSGTTYKIDNSNMPTSGWTSEETPIDRKYGWHQGTYIVYHDLINTDKVIMKLYIDGNLMQTITGDRKPTSFGFRGEWKYKGTNAVLTNSWNYSGEATNSLQPTAGNIPAKNSGETVPVFNENGKATPLVFYSQYEVYEDSALENIALQTKSGANIKADIKVEGTKITVTPKYSLDYDTEYQIVVNQALMSPAADLGRPMKLRSAYKITFKTEKPAFTVSDIALSDKTYTANITRNTEESVGLYAVMSTFDSEGKVVEAIAKEFSSEVLTHGEAVPVEITAIKDFVNAEIYFWDSIKNKEINSYGRNITLPRPMGTEVTAGDESFVNVTMRDEDDTLLISGFNGRALANVPVIVRIVNPKADFSADHYDYTTADEEKFGDIYYRCEEILTKADGTFSYTVKMDGLNGLHQIIVNMPDDEVFVNEFSFTAKELVDDAMLILKGSNENTIATNLNSVKNKLGMIDKRFDNLSNKQFVYNFMLSKITSLGDSFDLGTARRAFKTALEYMYNAENTQGIKEWLKQDGNEWTLKGTVQQSVFMDMSELKVNRVAEYLKKSVSMQEYADNFINGVIMTELKLIGNKNIVLTTFGKFPETDVVDLTDYSQLKSDTRKDNVNIAFLEQIQQKNTYAEAIALYEALAKSELDDQIYDELNSGGDSYGGSSGGGSGSFVPSVMPEGIILDAPEDIVPVTTPEWYVDPSTVQVFNDLSDAEWAKEYINDLYTKGIINGVGDGKFAPNNHVKKEEIAKMIVVALKLEATEGETPDFLDVDKNSWYYEYVKIAYQHGIINGVGDNRFGVGEYATREAVATMICRAAEAKGMYLDDVITIYPFDDRDNISDWAVESVEILRESMIINGMYANMFVPKNKITRAETAKLVYGLLQYE